MLPSSLRGRKHWVIGWKEKPSIFIFLVFTLLDLSKTLEINLIGTGVA